MMQWFKNFRIATKLIIGFIIVAIIAGFVGIVGIVNLKAIAAADKDMYELNTVPMDQIANVSDAYSQTRVAIRDMMLDKNVANREQYSNTVKQNIGIMKGELEKFSKTLQSEEGRKLVQDLNSAILAYEPYTNKLYELIIANNSDEAYSKMQSEGLQYAKQIGDAINRLTEIKTELAKQKATDNAAKANSATTMMIIIIIVGVVIAMVLGIFISSIISVPVNIMVAAAEKLAAGDMNIIAEIESKDEIGILAKAFKKAIIAISNLTSDANMLVQAAVEGKLSTRADASKHNGEYRKIVEGVNSTLNAVIAPVMESSAVLEEMSKGNIHVNVKGDYAGDNAKIKDALNDTIDTLSSYINEISSVLTQIAEGNLDVSITAD